MAGYDLEQHEVHRAERDPSHVHRAEGIVLHADLVGFSTIAAQAEADGPEGAERFAAQLDLYFCTLIDSIRAQGGIVAGMVGDALTAIWVLDDDRAGLRAAIQAADAVHRTMPMGLACRISLAGGPVALTRHTPPGTGEIWLLSGAAALEAAKLNGHAPAGRTVLAPDLTQAARTLGFRIEDGLNAALLQPLVLTDIEASSDIESPWSEPEYGKTPLALLWREMGAGGVLHDSKAAVFRNLTIVSVDLSEGAGSEGIGPAALDQRLGDVMAEIALWQGVAVNVLAEEKGVVLHIAFGLPPAGPEKRQSRAIHAALALHRAPTTRKMPIGVSSGRMFVAAHGRAPVRTVSAFGWPSALSTRLMQAEPTALLADTATTEILAEQFDLAPAPQAQVKGAQGPVEAVRIKGRKRANADSVSIRLPGPLEAVLEQGSPVSGVAILGRPGLGKSRLCATVAHAAIAQGWQVAAPVPRPGAMSQPFDGLIRILTSLAPDVELPTDGRAIAAHLSTQLDTLSDGEQPPLLVIVDDAHTLDPDSAELLRAAAQRGALRLVMAASPDRPLPDLPERIELEPLSIDAARDLVRERSGVEHCEPEALGLLHQRSGGNPMHLRELVNAMLADGSLTREGGALRLPTDGAGTLAKAASAAASMADLTLARLDQLPASLRDIIAIGAVLGEPFTPDDIAALCDMTAEEVADGIASLIGHDMLSTTADGRSLISSAVVRDVAYDGLPYRTRQMLHRRIAQQGTSGDLAMEARHWTGAGLLAEAITCHERIAHDAVAAHAHRTTIVHAAQARRLSSQTGEEISAPRRQTLALIEGTAALEDVELAHAHSCLTDLLHSLGDPIPASAPARGLKILGALTRQIGHRLSAPQPRPDPAAAMSAQAQKHLAEIAYFDGDIPLVLLHTLNSLNAAERTGSVSETVAGFSALSIGLETARLRRFADAYTARAVAAAQAGNHPPDIAFAALVAMVLYAGRADWDAAQRNGHSAATLYRKLGSEGRWQQSVATLVHIDLNMGGAETSRDMHTALDASADLRTSAQIRMWSLWAHAVFQMRAGPLPDPINMNALLSLLDHPKLNEADRLGGICVAAHGALRVGDMVQARSLVDRALSLGEARPPAAWHLSSALGALCVTAAIVDHGTPHGRARLTRAVAITRKFARVLPVGRATLAFAEGLLARADNRDTAARRAFERAAKWETAHDQADTATFVHRSAEALTLDPAMWILT